MMEGRVLERSGEKLCKEPPQLFTYYQGDINTAVDEHFFRALNKATIPKDLSIKAKDSSNRTFKSDAPTSSYTFAGVTSLSTHPYDPSKLTQLTSIDTVPPSQGVIMNPPGLSSSLPSSLWPSSSRQGTGFELPHILYQQPTAPESGANSYLNLVDRPTGGIMVSPFSKSDTRPEWNAGTSYKDIPGSRIGLDSGVPVTEISKDLYWY